MAQYYLAGRQLFLGNYIYICMSIDLKVLVLSVVCDDLLYAKMTLSKVKSRICQSFFLRKFRESSKIWLELTGTYMDFLKIKFIYGDFSQEFGESFDKVWRKTAFSWKLGG